MLRDSWKKKKKTKNKPQTNTLEKKQPETGQVSISAAEGPVTGKS